MTPRQIVNELKPTIPFKVIDTKTLTTYTVNVYGWGGMSASDGITKHNYILSWDSGTYELVKDLS